MQLKHLSIGELVAGAGGDPWEVNRTLQAGQPGRIANLANAFHGAGRSTAEADHAFELALSRFNAAWNHQNGDHPINDSAEVQRTVKSLGAFKNSVERNQPLDHPTGSRFLWPKTDGHPESQWVGTERAHILSIATSGRDVTVIVCDTCSVLPT